VWRSRSSASVNQLNLFVGPSLLIKDPDQRGVYTVGPLAAAQILGKYTGVKETQEDVDKVGESLKIRRGLRRLHFFLPSNPSCLIGIHRHQTMRIYFVR
jgi:hypothetical protein